MTRTSLPRRARAPRRSSPFALRLELLEDRCVLAAFVVNSAQDLASPRRAW